MLLYLCETKIDHDVMLSSKGHERDYILIWPEYNESVKFHIYQSFPSRVAGSNKWNSGERWLPFAASSIHYLTECKAEQRRLGVFFFFFSQHIFWRPGLLQPSESSKINQRFGTRVGESGAALERLCKNTKTKQKKDHTGTTHLKLDPNVKKCLM